jgi:conflict system pore-forming effector with SLATT domain
MSEQSRQRLSLYSAARVGDQVDYYGRSAAEYDRASAQSVALAAVLLSLTTLAGTLAGLEIGGKLGWAIAAAVIPAVSTALAAYDAVFGFERVSKLYSDAVHSLHRIEEPELAGLDDEAAAASVAAYAEAVEAVLRTEQAQWGQLTAEIELPGRDKQP